MTVLAVAMGLLNFDVAPGFVGLGFVLMSMVAKVRRGCPLVRTVDRRRRPGKLDRQNQHQHNQKQFFHGWDDITIGLAK